MGQILRTRNWLWWDQGHNQAPESWLATMASVTPSQVYINGAGEVLPDSAPYADTDQARALAAWISQGGIWLDYCGYPMFYEETYLGTSRQGENGFRDFLRAAGYDTETTFYSSDFVYPRSLVVKGSGQKPVGMIINTEAPQAGNTYSSFALQIGKGWYFYAYASNNPKWPVGVPPEKLFPMMKRVLEAGGAPGPLPYPDPIFVPEPVVILDPITNQPVYPPTFPLPNTNPPPQNQTAGPMHNTLLPLLAVGGLVYYIALDSRKRRG